MANRRTHPTSIRALAFSAMALIVVFGVVFTSMAGIHFSKAFNQSTTSTNLDNTDSLFISVNYDKMLARWGPGALNGGSNNSKGPGAIVVGLDTLKAFWMKKGIDEELYSRDFVIKNNNVTASTPSTVSDLTFQSTKYMYVSAGDGKNFAVSFWDNVRKSYVVNSYGKGATFYNSNLGSKPSCLALNPDTILLVYTREIHNSLYWQTVRSTSSSITVTQNWNDNEISPTNGDNFNNQLSNPSAVTDEAGNILVLYRKGTSYDVTQIDYHILDPSRTTKGNGTIDTKVCDGDASLYRYPAAKAYSYGTRKFAVTYWKNNTAKLALCEFATDWSLSTTIVDISTSGRFPTVTGNSAYLLVAWNEEITGTTSAIRAVRFDINSGAVQTGSPTTLDLATTAVQGMRNDTTCAIQAAMDSAGNAAIVWTTPDSATGVVMTNTPIHYDSGTYISTVDSTISGSALATTSDSIKYLSFANWPDSSFSGTNGSHFELSVRNGATAADAQAASWVGVNNDGTITSSIDGAKPYYQYRLKLYAPDTVYTPRVDSVQLAWNVKPRKPVVDSVLINGVQQIISENDTVTMLARNDSAQFHFSTYDMDHHASLQWTLQHQSASQTTSSPASPGYYRGSLTVPVFAGATAPAAARVFATDSLNWQSDPYLFSVQAVNRLPRCSVVAQADTIGDGIRFVTIAPVPDSFFISVQSSDTTYFTLGCKDENDTSLSLAVYQDGTKLQDIAGDSIRYFKFPNSRVQSGFALLDFQISDPDTTIHNYVRIGSNHPPAIDSLHGPQNSLGREIPAYLHCQPGATNRFVVQATDVDIPDGDALTYRWRLNNRLLTATGETLSITIRPPGDNSLSVVVTDRAGRFDSSGYTIQFPFMDTTSNEHQGALVQFQDSISLIHGGNTSDTIRFTIQNSGNGNSNFAYLAVNQVYTKNNNQDWLSFSLGGTDPITTNTHQSQINAENVAVGSSVHLDVFFRLDELQGDGVLTDTLYVETSDYLNPVLSIPIRMVYNDLPFVASLNFDFQAGGRLPKRKDTVYQPVFPPDADLMFAFSEPIDTTTVSGAVTVYSFFDFWQDGQIVPIAGQFLYAATADTVRFEPNYNRVSPHFGYQPPQGMFIATDSLYIRVTNDITDLVGNRLDITQSKVRVAVAETTYTVRVDSAPFCVASVFPDSTTAATCTTDIRVVFSRPLDSSSVDTSLENNRSIRIQTKYSGGQQIPYSSFRMDSISITVHPKWAFFHNDSVWVSVAANIRDREGYTLESNGDGVFSYYYDSTDVSDTYTWYFLTEPTGFYIFPNPYKPAHDSRHQEVGGIVFKNLNRLTEDGGQLDVRIYSLRGTEVYSSLRANQDLRVRRGIIHRAPLWIWDTRNQHGTEVASGLYYYVIRNSDNKPIQKGKLMIIR